MLIFTICAQELLLYRKPTAYLFLRIKTPTKSLSKESGSHAYINFTATTTRLYYTILHLCTNPRLRRRRAQWFPRQLEILLQRFCLREQLSSEPNHKPWMWELWAAVDNCGPQVLLDGPEYHQVRKHLAQNVDCLNCGFITLKTPLEPLSPSQLSQTY